MKDRRQFILETCSDKKVLHLGCCGSPFCQVGCKNGNHFHFEIQKVAMETYGVDININDIKFLQEEFGIKNLYAGNAEELEKLFQEEKFEVVVAGEIIEHLYNPGKFLLSIKSVLSENGVLILSTPNAVCFRRGVNALFGKETVHPDHNFYFSRLVLTHLLTVLGYKIIEMHGYRMMDTTNIKAFFIDKFVSFFSEFACEGIICLAKIRL